MLRLSRAQVREIDRRAVEEFHIPGIVLMENASRAVADAALEMMGNANVACAIVCGGGNNGGDGYAAARHLHNAGWNIAIVNAWSKPPTGDAGINYRVAQSMKLREANQLGAVDLVIDALFGTGLTRPPEGENQKLIDTMNAKSIPILAVDVPSGLDCDSGEPLGACVRAARTITFVTEKLGFANPKSKVFTGQITIGDIGCPRELIEEFNHRDTEKRKS